MAGLGFSITELIKAVKTFNDVRGSFTDRYTNSRTLIRKLAGHINTFCQLLEQHKALLEARGETYDGHDSFSDTLDECRAFINGYKVLLIDSRLNPEAWIRTARFTFEKENIARLQGEITTEMQKINMFFNINTMARENARRSISVPQNDMSGQVGIPTSGILNFEQVSPLLAAQMQRRETQSSVGYIDPNRFESNQPRTTPINISPRTSNTSPLENSLNPGFAASQAMQNVTGTTLPAPNTQNPDANQPFCTVRVKGFQSLLPFNKMPVIETHEKGWDIVFYTPKLRAKYRHTVRKPYEQTSYPYTLHKDNWENPKEDRLGVEIKYYNQEEQDHHVEVLVKASRNTNELTVKPYVGSPKYIFSNEHLFKDFQSLLYGKTLIKYFDTDNIMTSLSRTANLSSKEQLKIWKTKPSNERITSSLSFYANNEDDCRNLEFSTRWFVEEAQLANKRVTLKVLPSIVSPPKEIASKTRRSFTQRTDSTNTTSRQSSIFSDNRRNTMASDLSDITDITMPSVQSNTSRATASTYSNNRRLPTFLERVKSFQYLKINFMTIADAKEFQGLFVQLWNQDAPEKLASSPSIVGWMNPSYSMSPSESLLPQSTETSPYMTAMVQPPSPGTSPTSWPLP